MSAATLTAVPFVTVSCARRPLSLSPTRNAAIVTVPHSTTIGGLRALSAAAIDHLPRPGDPSLHP